VPVIVIVRCSRLIICLFVLCSSSGSAPVSASSLNTVAYPFGAFDIIVSTFRRVGMIGIISVVLYFVGIQFWMLFVSQNHV